MTEALEWGCWPDETNWLDVNWRGVSSVSVSLMADGMAEDDDGADEAPLIASVLGAKVSATDGLHLRGDAPKHA